MSGPRPRRSAGPRRTLGDSVVLALRWAFHGTLLDLMRAIGALSDPDLGRRLRRGPWRVVVEEGSMLPTLRPGDWLLVDPTTREWPRRGTLVVIRDPLDGDLALKRVAARPGDRVPFADGYLHLGSDEAWLLSDADEATTAAAGFGPPIDSRRYGPVTAKDLLGRAWFRYGPIDRIGPLRSDRDHRRVPPRARGA
jgi:hypothetical protein